ncbi:MAG: phosphoribosylformylglycinamidine cyclo-ligase [Acidobacteriota bacterium]|nr:MAG: phosphoribosylformylglycinamidine cyclo-ligase [Acidobacteriota bacterium]
MTKKLTYASAGVSLDRWEKAYKRMKRLVDATRTREALSKVGTFGGLFKIPRGYREPVLVTSTDGVGTKLKIAFLMRRHDTVGEDLVNHCINDILVQGAQPLFFLDYMGCGKLKPSVAADVVKGFARACKREGVTLLGGETAEMPGFYAPGEYDLAGFVVGVVERKKIITGARIRPGDVLYGLPSTGLHTNGYSLARRVFFDRARWRVSRYVPELRTTLGEALLRPHRSYAKTLRRPVDRGWIKGLAHITGGGLTDNLPRILPAGRSAAIDARAWRTPPLFRLIQEMGRVSDAEMHRTFNMGVGMVAAVSPRHRAAFEAHLRRRRERFFVVGEVQRGRRMVRYG